MFNRKNILLCLVIFLLFSTYSCLDFKQPNPDIRYYTLEYGSPEYTGKAQRPYIIKLENFKISPVYDTTNIIYRKEAYERDSYTYYRWRVNPSDLVTYLVGRDLKSSGLFKGVVLPGERNRDTSFRVEGIIDEFYELDGTREWNGVLSISISVTPEENGKNVFQKTYKAAEKCEKKNPASLAEALSKAMEKISSEITEDLYDYTGE